MLWNEMTYVEAEDKFRGIPTGGEIEFADEDTLGSAIERRG